MNFGIIGAGAIARRAHLPSLLQVPGTSVAVLADLDLDLAQKVAAEFHIERYVSDYWIMLDNPSVQAVAICTSTPSHFKIAMDVLDAGKHVILEKPMVMSLREALQLYEEVEETGLKFSVVQNYRFMDAAIRAKMRIQGGFIGTVTSMHADSLSFFPVGWTDNRWLYHKYAVLYDFAPHVIDMTLWCFDAPLKRVYAIGRDWTGDFGFLTFAQIMLEFETGATATIDASWLSGTLRFWMDVRGTAGYIQFDPMRNNYSEVHGSLSPLQELREFSARMWRYWEKITGKGTDPLSVYPRLYSEFIQCVENDTSPPVTVREGTRVNMVLEAAQESIETGLAVDVMSFLKQRGIGAKIAKQII